MNAHEEEHINHVTVEQQPLDIQSGNKPQLRREDVPGSGNIDKIRDILFGNQMRDYAKRFNHLEERLVKESSTLRDETRKRLDLMETYVQKEVQLLTDWLKKQQAERDEVVRELTQEYKETIRLLEKKLAQLDEQVLQSDRALRQQILDQTKSIDDEIRQRHEEVLAVLERKAKELGTEKTDRATLAALFAEVAMRLNGNSL